METNIWVDDKQFKARDFKHEHVQLSGAENNLKKISFAFKVSSEEYHDVAVLLYKNDFQVRVPELDLEFPATIHNYATDRTDLYKEGQTADYYLELIEKRN